MKTAVALLAGIVLGALGVFFGYPVYEMRGAEMNPECTTVVKLSLAGSAINAVPPNACLHRGRKLTWDVSAGAQDKVEIDFKQSGGPFEHGVSNNPHNPRKGHYEITGPGDIDSNKAIAKGRWEYKVTWTPQGGQPIVLDPAVCIRGG